MKLNSILLSAGNCFKRNRNESVLVGACAFLVALFLWKFSGGAQGWDELQYMHISLNPEPHPHVLNRYFHIYSQRFFFWLGGGPFNGARLFWSFLVTCTTVLAYIGSRLLFNGKRILPPIMASILFLSSPQVLERSGVTISDFTSMTLVSLGVVLYLLFLSVKSHRRTLLILFGLVLFCCIKSKETGIVLGLGIIGFGFQQDESFKLSQLMHSLKYVCAGVAAGQVLLMVLDGIYLRDMWFSVRWSSVSRLMDFNFGFYVRTMHSWYSYLLRTAPFHLILFILVLTGSQRHSLCNSKKTICLIPIALIVFLTYSMIRGRWGVIPRYFLPGTPMLCVVASGFFTFSIREALSQWNRQVKQTIVILGLTIIAAVFVHQSASNANWGPGRFAMAVVYPITLSILIVLVLVVRNWGLGSLVLLSASLLFAIAMPLARSAYIMVQGKPARYSEARFAPFAAFAEYVSDPGASKIYISRSFHDSFRILCRDKDSCRWMFNLFFNCRISESQAVYGNDPNVVSLEDCEYGWMTSDDLAHMLPEDRERMERTHLLRFADKTVFAKKKVAD